MEAPTNEAIDRSTRGFQDTDPQEKVVDQCCSCIYDCFQGVFDFLCCNSDFCY
ncbi:unnamed protein product [Amaranthus hypochondriacus]